MKPGHLLAHGDGDVRGIEKFDHRGEEKVKVVIKISSKLLQGIQKLKKIHQIIYKIRDLFTGHLPKLED